MAEPIASHAVLRVADGRAREVADQLAAEAPLEIRLVTATGERTLTVIYVMVATLIHAGIVTLAGAARGLLYDPARERVVRRVLAVALALVAVWFAIASQADLPA